MDMLVAFSQASGAAGGPPSLWLLIPQAEQGPPQIDAQMIHGAGTDGSPAGTVASMTRPHTGDLRRDRHAVQDGLARADQFASDDFECSFTEICFVPRARATVDPPLDASDVD